MFRNAIILCLLGAATTAPVAHANPAAQPGAARTMPAWCAQRAYVTRMQGGTLSLRQMARCAALQAAPRTSQN